MQTVRMWCGHAYILALPLGQCPFMDTARKVAGTPHAPYWRTAAASENNPIRANGGLSVRAGRCTYKYRGSAGGAASADAIHPGVITSTATVPAHHGHQGLNVRSASGAASANAIHPGVITLTATVPARSTKAPNYLNTGLLRDART